MFLKTFVLLSSYTLFLIKKNQRKQCHEKRVNFMQLILLTP